jgi:hypothetical protein
MKCLVLTATQSDADGYSSWLLTKKNFSDSKKKIANVSALFGINCTEEERRMNVCRLNPIAIREADYLNDTPGTIVGVAGCSKVGRPHIVSTWI